MRTRACLLVLSVIAGVALTVTPLASASSSWLSSNHAGRSGEVPRPDPPKGWASVSAGASHTCAIRDSGSLWCWGSDGAGQLGDGGRRERHAPVQVGSRTDWVAVTAGHDATCAVAADGTLWCWGDGARGQLGDGGTGVVRTPEQIGTATDWTSIVASNGGAAASDRHLCGSRADGSVWCWGQNDLGQVGDGTTTDRSTPVQVGSGTDWTQVSAGNLQSCGRRSDATIWCWGRIFHAGHDVSSPVPLQLGQGTVWTSVWAGATHDCALNFGRLWCWGHNAYGQLGDGTRVDHFEPERVGKSPDWYHVGNGARSTCARQHASLWCWGSNRHGEDGDGTTEDRLAPTEVTHGPQNWRGEVAIRFEHGCSTGADGSLWCWGRNDAGQVGDGTTVDRPAPVQIKAS